MRLPHAVMLCEVRRGCRFEVFQVVEANQFDDQRCCHRWRKEI